MISCDELKFSKFGFGTASLHHVDKKQRKRLLDMAIDVGITHFDTAPYYAFGFAEKYLSAISSRKNVTISSKCGLYAPGGEDQSFYQMYARKLTGKIIPKVSKPIIDFSIEKASKSLDGSRRRLKRDYLDIFLLHEPEVDLLNIDEWIDWLDRQVHIGNIREYGIAGNLIRVKEVFLTNKNLTSIVQTECSLDQDTKLEAQIRSKAKYQFRYGCIRSIGSKDIAQTLDMMANDQFKKTYLISTRKKQHLEELGRALNGT